MQSAVLLQPVTLLHNAAGSCTLPMVSSSFTSLGCACAADTVQLSHSNDQQDFLPHSSKGSWDPLLLCSLHAVARRTNVPHCAPEHCRQFGS